LLSNLQVWVRALDRVYFGKSGLLLVSFGDIPCFR